jgi:hypothetical protein
VLLDYGLANHGIRFRLQVGAANSSSFCFQTDSATHAPSCATITEVFFHQFNAAGTWTWSIIIFSHWHYDCLSFTSIPTLIVLAQRVSNYTQRKCYITVYRSTRCAKCFERMYVPRNPLYPRSVWSQMTHLAHNRHSLWMHSIIRYLCPLKSTEARPVSRISSPGMWRLLALTYAVTRRHIPEDGFLYSHRRETSNLS